MAQGVERFFKAAIVDRNPSIASAALVSAYHLYPHAKDVVKRWVNEVQEAVNAKSSSTFFGSSGGGGYLGFGGGSGQPSGPQTIPSTSYIAQYHALGLLYLIRQQDRMAITKMIQQLGGGKSGAGTTLKNPMALCMLIRYAAKVMEEDPKCVDCTFSCLPSLKLVIQCPEASFGATRRLATPQERHGKLRGCTCHLRNEECNCCPINETNRWCVNRTFCHETLLNIIIPAVLQVFLTTPKPVLKFAAARTLASLALTHPASVATCNIDLETLIADPNRSVATYAITTLLKVYPCSCNKFHS